MGTPPPHTHTGGHLLHVNGTADHGGSYKSDCTESSNTTPILPLCVVRKYVVGLGIKLIQVYNYSNIKYCERVCKVSCVHDII